MKKERHSIILNLIETYSISTQEELLEKLHDCGVSVTQATVSRDIKELRLVKQPISGGLYKYSLATGADEKYIKYYSIFSESVISVDHAQNLCLVKCHPGTASAAGAAIDALEIPNVLGSLAGDDTIFILCKTDKAAIGACRELESLIK